jgi:hypothetical protein
MLSGYALAKKESDGPGIINIRSYNSIWSFMDDTEKSVFISYTPLEKKHRTKTKDLYLDSENHMIIKFQIEDMNKPQLHRIPIVFGVDKFHPMQVFQLIL